MSDEYQTALRDIIADVLEVEPYEVTKTADFVDDLGADSLRVIEILSRMEKHFSVQIDQSNLSRMTSLETVEELLQEVMAAA